MIMVLLLLNQTFPILIRPIYVVVGNMHIMFLMNDLPKAKVYVNVIREEDVKVCSCKDYFVLSRHDHITLIVFFMKSISLKAI